MRRATGTAKLLVLVVGVCYAAALGMIYVRYVSPIFAYQGMVVQVIPTYLSVFQVMLAALPALFLPVDLNKPSEFQVLLLHIIVYVPSIMVGYHICSPEKWEGYTIFMVLLAGSLISLCQVSRLPPLRLPSFNRAIGLQVLVAVLFTVAAYAAVIIYYGAPDNLFNIAEIYKSRADFKQRSADVPSLVNYLYWWQGIVINPVVIIAGILRKNALLLIIGIALEALLFSLTTLRTMLLTVLFSIFIVLYLNGGTRWRGLGFLTGITVSMIAGSVLMAGEGISAVATRIFVQRWLAIQGQLSGAYFDFFSDNVKAYLGNSVLHGLVSYNYGDLSPGEVIGDQYVSFGRGPIANATANFWADAFGQFGFLGILVASVVAFFLLWVVDSAFRNYPRGVAVMLFSTCALSLTEQGVQMALLTGGVLPLLIIARTGQRFFNIGDQNATPYRSLNLRS